MEKNERCLILGSAGYIGKVLASELVSNGYEVCGIDLEANCSPDYVTKQGDLLDTDFFNNTLSDFDPHLIIDLAARTEVDDNLKLEDYEVNIRTPDLILSALKTCRVNSLRKVVFTSTQYVIGPTFSHRNKLAYAPHTAYGQSKVLLEQNIQKNIVEFADYGVKIAVVRPTNVWGGCHPKYSSVWEPLLQRGLVAIPSKMVSKSYCHLSSLVKLYYELLQTDLPSDLFEDCVIYGTDKPCPQRDWVEIQSNELKKLGFKASFHCVPIWLLFLLSYALQIVSLITRTSNKLPRTRVLSMIDNYYVDTNRPEALSQVQSLSEITSQISMDFQQRYAYRNHSQEEGQ